MLKQSLRLALSKPSTSIQLCLVGLAAGLIAAAVIIVFRVCLELLHIAILGDFGNYTALTNWQLFLLPIIAIIIVIMIARLTGFKHYRLGIPFVIHRYKLHNGHIPLATSINQFFGGILALASGFVVGKEGPTVHLAAAASHYIGRWFKLPFNSLRILAGCGIAAGIAAAFNTPFAAVIFVMEVVMREYKVHIFVPVMLAAACGSVFTRMIFGDVTELSFLTFQAMHYWHFPILIVLGALLGMLASIFNKQLMFTMRMFRPFKMVTRLLIAGVVTGSVAYFMPNALGAEFININTFISSTPELWPIFLLFAAKFCLAIIAIALGVPGGIIGAVMVIGILAGVLFLQPLQILFFQLIENVPAVSSLDINEMTVNYALLGLAGFLAAVLHAPMAALSAAMELSSTQQVILPAIITIVSAYVTSKQLCKNRSIFLQQLEYQGLPYTTTLIRDELQHTGVMAIMSTDFTLFKAASKETIHLYLQENPETLVVNASTENTKSEYQPQYSAKKVEQHQQIQIITNVEFSLHCLSISLQENSFPITSNDIIAVSDQATLADVYELLYKQRQGGVAIVSQISLPDAPSIANMQVCGVITWQALHTYLLRQQH